jgi:hypothetical protein
MRPMQTVGWSTLGDGDDVWGAVIAAVQCVADIDRLECAYFSHRLNDADGAYANRLRLPEQRAEGAQRENRPHGWVGLLVLLALSGTSAGTRHQSATQRLFDRDVRGDSCRVKARPGQASCRRGRRKGPLLQVSANTNRQLATGKAPRGEAAPGLSLRWLGGCVVGPLPMI